MKNIASVRSTLSYQVDDNKIFTFEVLKILFAPVHKKYKCRIPVYLCSVGGEFSIHNM